MSNTSYFLSNTTRIRSEWEPPGKRDNFPIHTRGSAVDDIRMDDALRRFDPGMPLAREFNVPFRLSACPHQVIRLSVMYS